jgi:hypothetical protein
MWCHHRGRSSPHAIIATIFGEPRIIKKAKKNLIYDQPISAASNMINLLHKSITKYILSQQLSLAVILSMDIILAEFQNQTRDHTK